MFCCKEQCCVQLVFRRVVVESKLYGLSQKKGWKMNVVWRGSSSKGKGKRRRWKVRLKKPKRLSHRYKKQTNKVSKFVVENLQMTPFLSVPSPRNPSVWSQTTTVTMRPWQTVLEVRKRPRNQKDSTGVKEIVIYSNRDSTVSEFIGKIFLDERRSWSKWHLSNKRK